MKAKEYFSGIYSLLVEKKEVKIEELWCEELENCKYPWQDLGLVESLFLIENVLFIKTNCSEKNFFVSLIKNFFWGWGVKKFVFVGGCGEHFFPASCDEIETFAFYTDTKEREFLWRSARTIAPCC